MKVNPILGKHGTIIGVDITPQIREDEKNAQKWAKRQQTLSEEERERQRRRSLGY